VYDKVLTASPASIREKSKEGEIINFLQVDSASITTTMMYCSTLVVSPIQIIVYIYLIFYYFGISFIFGLGVLLIFLLINLIMINYYNIIQDAILAKKDKRLKVTTETLNSLKILKLYAWENEFMKRINSSREEEIKEIKKEYTFFILTITMF